MLKGIYCCLFVILEDSRKIFSEISGEHTPYSASRTWPEAVDGPAGFAHQGSPSGAISTNSRFA